MNTLKEKYFTGFPYLNISRDILKKNLSYYDTFEDFLNADASQNAINHAIQTIRVAIGSDKRADVTIIDYKKSEPNVIFKSYYFAKLLLNSSKYTKTCISKYSEYIANISMEEYNIMEKNPNNEFKIIKNELGYIKENNTIDVIKYIQISTLLKSENEKYKLVNMPIKNGIIEINPHERDKFFKAHLIYMINKNLKMKVNNTVKQMLSPYLEKTFEDYYDKTITDYGELSLPDYPPCILSLMTKLNNNQPLTHPERFTLVTFCHKTGMENTEIAKLFSKNSKFNLNTTMYQIRHITGEEGADEYVVPSCDTLKTNGVCVSNEGICKRIKHPLGYYIVKKGLLTNKDTNKTDDIKKDSKKKYTVCGLKG